MVFNKFTSCICIILYTISVHAQQKQNTGFEFETDSLVKFLTHHHTIDTNRANALIELAVLQSTFNINQSLAYIAEAKSVAQQLNSPAYIARVNFTYGNIYRIKANYKESLFYYFQALHAYEQLHKVENTARCLYNIGVVYSYLNKYPLAEKYFNQALEIKIKNNSINEIGIIYTGLGYLAETEKNYKKALYYYKKTLANGIEIKNAHMIQIAYSDMASIYLEQQNTTLAKEYLKLALEITRDAHNIEQTSINYLYLGNAYAKENNLVKAEECYLKSEEYARSIGLRDMQKQCFKALSDIYHRQHKDDMAYAFRLKYETLNDSILNDETYKQVNDIQTAYEIEKKNSEINLLNKDKELASVNASKNELLRNILIAICFLILVIAIVLLRNVRLKQRLNKTLKNQNKQLEEENIFAKYEVLKSRVNPHFLFNSLNTLTSIIATDKQKAIEFIEHFSELYRKILESGEIGFITLEEEIKISQNYIYLQQVRFGNKLHIEFKTTDTKNYTVPSFAIQMMIENAIKHNIISTAKNLLITITQHPDFLIIENNLQPKGGNTPSTKIGQQNIMDRYKPFSNIIPVFEMNDTHYKVTLPLIYTPQ